MPEVYAYVVLTCGSDFRNKFEGNTVNSGRSVHFCGEKYLLGQRVGPQVVYRNPLACAGAVAYLHVATRQTDC